MKKHSQRAQRVGDQIQKELADLLRHEVKDPRVGQVTVTSVDVSPDLSHARVNFTHFAGREHGDAVVARLLALPQRAVPRLANSVERKLLTVDAKLLQADDVRLRFCEPLEKPGQAPADAVDVERCNFHRVLVERVKAPRRRAGVRRGTRRNRHFRIC